MVPTNSSFSNSGKLNSLKRTTKCLAAAETKELPPKAASVSNEVVQMEEIVQWVSTVAEPRLNTWEVELVEGGRGGAHMDRAQKGLAEEAEVKLTIPLHLVRKVFRNSSTKPHY
jgi:hypothetical protein